MCVLLPSKPPIGKPTYNHRKKALFDDAPVDANLFISYIHQNYTGFCKEIEECEGILDSMSASDALMRIEGDRVRISSYFHRFGALFGHDATVD